MLTRAVLSLLIFTRTAPFAACAEPPAADPVVLAAQAAEAFRDHRFGDALEAFKTAAELRPGDATLWLGAGAAAYMLGHNADSETFLFRALQLDPRQLQASLLLGDLQYHLGRIEEAIATYETGLKHNPGERALAEKLERWKRDTRLSSRFYESRGSHFRVLFEGPSDEGFARRAVEILDAAYWRIGGILTVYPSETFTVILYTLQQFRDVTRAPAWAGGMYDGQIRVAVRGAFDQPSEFERVLTHEFVHAVVAMLGGHNVPWWINEGLATALEPQGIEWAGSVLDSTSARLPLSRLHDSVQRFTGNDVSIAYAESTVAVHRMLNLQGPFAFVALLRDIYGGTPFESAFHHRMSLPYEDFQRLIAQR